MFELRLHFVPF
jgi:hypothetical protein